ncbi:hypothetical protein LC593_04955 [Nostoc sp. CHAB 5844]|nr:hypothetical protein [Nostoc sp. CHAB 5844]
MNSFSSATSQSSQTEGVTSIRQTRYSKPFSLITLKKIVWLLCHKTGIFDQSMA